MKHYAAPFCVHTLKIENFYKIPTLIFNALTVYSLRQIDQIQPFLNKKSIIDYH